LRLAYRIDLFLSVAAHYTSRCQLTGRPLRFGGEESPGSIEARCRLTAGGGDPRESATETYRREFRGKGEMVR